MAFIKNIDHETVLNLADQIHAEPGQIVSKTLAQNKAVSLTLFAFSKGEEISTHESGGDAFVTCLDGVGKITIDGENQHIYKPVRIGMVNADGLIDEVWSTPEPVKPDPYLKGYEWAAGLSGAQ